MLQLADGFVLLIADSFRRALHLRSNFMHRPAVEAQLQDALLPGRQDPFSGLVNGVALLGPDAFALLIPVGHTLGEVAGQAARPLHPLLDGVDGPQELLAFLALAP